jgi:hypothetical protein
MTTNQESRQANLREQISTTNPIVGDWHAFWDSISVPVGTFNERMLTWINTQLGTSYSNVLGAMHAFAESRGFDRWSDITGLDLNAAQALVVGYSSDGDGFAAIFESRPSIYVKDSGTPANDTSLELASDGLDDFSAFLTSTSPSVKSVMQADGTIKYAAQNLVVNSEDFSSWSGTGRTVSPNTSETTASDGTNNADKVTITGTDALYEVATTARYYTYAYSIELKDSSTTWVAIRSIEESATTNQAKAWFNLATGAKGATATGGTGVTVVDSSIEPLGDGWYRCTLISAHTAATATSLRFQLTSADGDASDARAATNSVYYAYKAHLYAYPADTSYLATTSAARYALPLQYSSGVAEGMLVEPAATNYIARYNEFATQLSTGLSFDETANAAVSPDGTMNASKISEQNATQSHFGNCTTTQSGSGVTLYQTVYLKSSGDGRYAGLRSLNTGVNDWIIVNPVDGSITERGANISASDTYSEDVGNGWFRVGFTYPSSGSNSAGFQLSVCQSATPGVPAPSYAGDGSSGFYAYGMQIEESTVPTSLVKTFGDTATRTGDTLSLATSAFPYADGGAGTAYAKYKRLSDVSGSNFILGFNDNTTVDSINISCAASIHLSINDGGTNQCNLDAGGASLDTAARQASAWSNDDFAAIIDAGSIATDNSGTLPESIVALNIGHRLAANRMHGLIKEIAYFPERLTNGQLEDLTSGQKSSLISTSLAQYWVANEANALSLDFLDTYHKDNSTSDFNGSAYVLDAGNGDNNFNGVPDDLLTYTTTTPKNVLNASGDLVYNPHQYVTYTDPSDTAGDWTTAAEVYINDGNHTDGYLVGRTGTSASQRFEIPLTSMSTSPTGRITVVFEVKAHPNAPRWVQF